MIPDEHYKELIQKFEKKFGENATISGWNPGFLIVMIKGKNRGFSTHIPTRLMELVLEEYDKDQLP